MMAFPHWLGRTILILGACAACIAGALVIGSQMWARQTRNLRFRMTEGRQKIQPTRYDPQEIANLPPPVQRYFCQALTPDQPMIAAARLSHTGTFRMDESRDRWIPFTSTQTVQVHSPGFVWDARMRMAPGLTVFVHDAYVAGEGLLHARALGLVTVAEDRGTPETAQGELSRYLAEAVWIPTALLPSQGVRWEAIDDRSARAILRDGSTTVSMVFRFDSDGLITSMHAASRYCGDVDGAPAFAPWTGRVWDYVERDGMRIPLEGQVAWDLPAGLAPYWRGRMTKIEYEFE